MAFLDNDDIWAPTKLERQLAALGANPDARWSATACVHVGPDLHVRWAARLRQDPLVPAGGTVVPSSDMVSLLSDEQRVPAGSSSTLASLEMVMAAGGFNLDVPGCEDWDLWLRLAQASPLLYVDLPLVAYRVWDGQTSANVRAQVESATVVRAATSPTAGLPAAATGPDGSKRLLGATWPVGTGGGRPGGTSAPPGPGATRASSRMRWRRRRRPRSRNDACSGSREPAPSRTGGKRWSSPGWPDGATPAELSVLSGDRPPQEVGATVRTDRLDQLYEGGRAHGGELLVGSAWRDGAGPGQPD